MKMVGIYLSGTGNTKHCVEKLMHLSDASAKTMPLEGEGIIVERYQYETFCAAKDGRINGEKAF